MRKRVVTAVVSGAACVALALPAHAAGPQIKDTKGDGGSAGTDIISVTFTTTFKTVREVRRPTGFTVKMLLDAAPAQQTWFRVNVSKPGCPNYFFEYTTSITGADSRDGTCVDSTNLSTVDPHVKAPTVSGSTITWRVPITAVPAGTKIKVLDADTSLLISVSTPVVNGSAGPITWDDAPAKAGTTYTVGR